MNITHTVTETDFVVVSLSELPEGITRDDLSSVEVAIKVKGTAVAESDWTAAESVPDTDDKIRLLVGPLADFGALDVGTYNLWTRLGWGPLKVERKAGTLRAITTA